MENLEIKQMILQLEKQDEDLIFLKKSISKIIDNTGKNDNSELNRKTINYVNSYINKHNIIEKQINKTTQTIEKIELYFSGIFSNLPLKTSQELTISGRIKIEAYLFCAFLAISITLSAIVYHNCKDDTDYEKAWNLLLDENLKDGQVNYLNSFLEKARK